MKIYNIELKFNFVNEAPPANGESPENIVNYMSGAFDDDPIVEWVFVVLLDAKYRPTGRHMVTKGVATSSLVAPREVLRPAILAGAASIVLVHNHPSGDPFPSASDINVTRKLRDACQYMDIPLTDHVIMGECNADPNGKGYYSFKEAGLL